MTRWFFLFRWSNGKVSHQALVLFFFFAPRHSSSLRLFFSSLFYFVVAELADMMVKFFGWFDFFFSLYLKSLMFTAKKWAFLLLLHSIYSEKIFLCAEWKIKCRSKLTRRKSGMCAITTTTIDIERQSNRNKKKKWLEKRNSYHFEGFYRFLAVCLTLLQKFSLVCMWRGAVDSELALNMNQLKVLNGLRKGFFTECFTYLTLFSSSLTSSAAFLVSLCIFGILHHFGAARDARKLIDSFVATWMFYGEKCKWNEWENFYRTKLEQSDKQLFSSSFFLTAPMSAISQFLLF